MPTPVLPTDVDQAYADYQFLRFSVWHRNVDGLADFDVSYGSTHGDRAFTKMVWGRGNDYVSIEAQWGDEIGLVIVGPTLPHVCKVGARAKQSPTATRMRVALASEARRRLNVLNQLRPMQGLKQIPWRVVDSIVWRLLPKPPFETPMKHYFYRPSDVHLVLSAALPGIFSPYGSMPQWVPRLERFVDSELVWPKAEFPAEALPFHLRRRVRERREADTASGA